MLFLTPLLGYVVLLIVCVIFSFSAECLVTQWVCLEINMLSILPLLISSGKKSTSLLGVKYLISQSVASLLFILSLVGSQEVVGLGQVMTLAILFKLALPPFHGWMLSMLSDLNYMEMWLLFTVQKLIPLMIVSHLSFSTLFLFGVVGSVMLFMFVSMNTIISLNSMLFISSVVNTAWMISVTPYMLVWFVYMLMYSYMLITLLVLLGVCKVYKMNDMLGIPKLFSFFLAVQVFNLGGVPPLTGFLVKLMMIKYLFHSSVWVVVLLVLSSLVLLFIYTSIFYQLYCFSPHQSNFNFSWGVGYLKSLSILSIAGSMFFMFMLI